MAGIQKMIFGDQAAEAAVRSNMKSSGDMYKRIAQLFDMYLGTYKMGKQSGLYDPARQIELSEKQSAYAYGLEQQGDAGAARILGYRVGDTVPLDTLRARSEAFKLGQQMNRFNITQQTAQNEFATLSGAPTGSVAQAGQGYTQNAGVWGNIANQSNPSNFWNAAMQWYAMSKGAKKTP